MAVANLPPLGKLPSQKTDEPAETKKKLEKVTKGEVKVKEKSLANKFADAFITDDLGAVKEHVVKEVIVPGIINAVLDAVNDGLSMFFKVTPRRSSRSIGSGGYVDYSRTTSTYKSSSTTTSSRNNEGTTGNKRIDYTGISFNSKDDANEVLSMMQDLAHPDQYGWASVADFYDLAGVSVSNQQFTDNKYGWNLSMLRTVKMRRDREGWYLDLPKPVVID